MIDRYKSGFVPPEDFPFEEQRAGADTTDAATTHHHHNHLTVRGTVSGNRIKKRGGLLSIFSSNKVRQEDVPYISKYDLAKYARYAAHPYLKYYNM